MSPYISQPNLGLVQISDELYCIPSTTITPVDVYRSFKSAVGMTPLNCFTIPSINWISSSLEETLMKLEFDVVQSTDEWPKAAGGQLLLRKSGDVHVEIKISVLSLCINASSTRKVTARFINLYMHTLRPAIPILSRTAGLHALHFNAACSEKKNKAPQVKTVKGMKKQKKYSCCLGVWFTIGVAAVRLMRIDSYFSFRCYNNQRSTDTSFNESSKGHLALLRLLISLKTHKKDTIMETWKRNISGCTWKSRLNDFEYLLQVNSA